MQPNGNGNRRRVEIAFKTNKNLQISDEMIYWSQSKTVKVV